MGTSAIVVTLPSSVTTDRATVHWRTPLVRRQVT